jgi:VWFA-related protein
VSQSFRTIRRAAVLLGFSLLALSSGVGLVFASAPSVPRASCNTGQLCVHIQQLVTNSSNQLLAYISVTGADGQPIIGLDPSAVSATVDGQQAHLQEVTGVTDIGQPLTAAVLLDTSTTMGEDGKLQSAKDAIKTFGQSLGAQDQVAFYQIAGDGPSGVHRLLNFTTDHSQLSAVVDPLQAGGKAPIYDALYQAAQDMASIQGRKLIVLQTDQHDDSSIHTLDQTLSLLGQVHQPVYTIGLGSDADLSTLREIAQATGGTAFANPDSTSLAASYQSILSQLRDSYRLTVQLANPLTVGAHTVQVQVQYQSQNYMDSKEFQVAATKMTLHLSLPAGAQVAGKTTVTLSTQGDDLPVRSVVVTLDGKSIAVTSSASGYQFDLDTRFVWPGTHQLHITVTDVAGNQATLSQALQVGVDWAFWLLVLGGLLVLILLLVFGRLARYRFGGTLEGTLTVRDAAGRTAQIALGQDVKGARMRLKITEDGVVIGSFAPRKKLRFEGPAKSVPAARTSKGGRTVQGQLLVAYERAEERAPRIPVQYFRQAGKDHPPLELVDGMSKKLGDYRIEYSD